MASPRCSLIDQINPSTRETFRQQPPRPLSVRFKPLVLPPLSVFSEYVILRSPEGRFYTRDYFSIEFRIHRSPPSVIYRRTRSTRSSTSGSIYTRTRQQSPLSPLQSRYFNRVSSRYVRRILPISGYSTRWESLTRIRSIFVQILSNGSFFPVCFALFSTRVSLKKRAK